MIIEEVFAKRKEARSWEEYHPHELAEMLECALLHIITLEVQATHLTQRVPDVAERAVTESGLYNCQVCGLEKCRQPGICDDCLTPPTEDEVKSWGVA